MSLQRLRKEYEQMKNDYTPNLSAAPVDDNLYQWEAIILGPTETPYEGGIFKLNISVLQDYPFKPPIVTFKTKIYHPNINSEGSICLDIFKDSTKWAATNTISTVIRSIILLLDTPNELSPWNKEANELYVNCQKDYNQMIKGVAVAEHSQYEQKAFARFKQTADKISAVNLSNYTQWFPQITSGVPADIKPFEEQLSVIVARKQRKREPKTSEKKVNLFDRYKK